MKTSKFNSLSKVVLALAFAPAIALAQPTPNPGSRVHMTSAHDSLAIHDRTPHVHDHTLVAHR